MAKDHNFMGANIHGRVYDQLGFIRCPGRGSSVLEINNQGLGDVEVEVLGPS